MKKISALSISFVSFAQRTVKTKQATVDYLNPLIRTLYAGFKKGLDGGQP